jgi:hypothetical protein
MLVPGNNPEDTLFMIHRIETDVFWVCESVCYILREREREKENGIGQMWALINGHANKSSWAEAKHIDILILCPYIAYGIYFILFYFLFSHTSPPP